MAFSGVTSVRLTAAPGRIKRTEEENSEAEWLQVDAPTEDNWFEIIKEVWEMERKAFLLELKTDRLRYATLLIYLLD